ncbi:thiamine phosphate synthase [Haliangium sp.]
MSWRSRLTGFYAILDRDDEHLARLLVRPVAAGGAGARVLQVRVKPPRPAPMALILRVARMARRVTAEAGALLIIDDHLDVALAIQADGVHLGQTDLPLAEARALLRRWQPAPALIVGVSTHDRAQVEAAVSGGADYLGYGPVFPTATKVDPDPVQGLDGLAAAVALAGETPVVAIGGVTPARAAAVAATGAAAACSISAINDAVDPARAGAALGAPWREAGAAQ